jgi:hypothetical protein
MFQGLEHPWDHGHGHDDHDDHGDHGHGEEEEEGFGRMEAYSRRPGA